MHVEVHSVGTVCRVRREDNVKGKLSEKSVKCGEEMMHVK